MKKTKSHQSNTKNENVTSLESQKDYNNSMDMLIMDRYKYLQFYISVEDLKRIK